MQLSEKELSEFRRWFAEFDADLWDEQIESDAAVAQETIDFDVCFPTKEKT